MPSSPAVAARALAKAYTAGAGPLARLARAAVGRSAGPLFWALRDVSFELARGESLAILGENGAGKSTLLKLIAGVTSPTSGALDVNGRLGAILELGSGFHPEFTGRENVRMNAALLGIEGREVERSLPAIEAFAELGDFFDRPVRQYSSGMAMRLGFSVATLLEPDLLIVDEALSVGDGYFQKKCVDRILEFRRRGGSLLFCSHAMYYVSEVCERALWLRHGEVAALGSTEDVVREYERFLLRKESASPGAVDERAPSAAAANRSLAKLRTIETVGASGEQPTFRVGDEVAIDVEWTCEDPQQAFHIAIGIDREEDELPVAAFATHYSGLPAWVGAERYRIRLEIPALPLAKGQFSLAVFLLDESGLHVFDRRRLAAAFAVTSSRFLPGLVEIAHTWRQIEPH